MEIKKITANEILDSRGNPTVLCRVFGECAGEKQGHQHTQNAGECECVGTASVPSGASTGEWEAVELRDGDKTRYNGKGVLKAVANVDEIAKAVVGKIDSTKQAELDRSMCILDGTNNKGRLGANAILGVSLGAMYLSATETEMQPYQYMAKLYREIGGKTTGKKLPLPSFNIINGGAHADSGIDCQEFMVQPIGGKNFAERLRMGSEITASLKKILAGEGLVTAVGDEGGFAPRLNGVSPIHGALDLIIRAIKNAGYTPEKDVVVALDVAASEFYNPETKKYEMKHEKKNYTTAEMVKFYTDLTTKYPILKSIEDPLDQNDWDGYAELTKALGKKIIFVGDDLFVTNKERLEKGIKMGACNAILIKLNQIGTLTETLETIKMAKDAGYKIMISHRSGETPDTTIADLAVAVDAEFIKSGAPVRGERVAKYNRLMLIETEI
ncbi:MAG: phosphopyruvate hydratase [Christensenellaceae bacterium]|jgi:enolase|nr:phosphopyruvate hydratase [Christensenellaceae bacterium]